MGAVHSLFCLGCCWAMMAVPVALGIYMKFDNRNWILYQLVEKRREAARCEAHGAQRPRHIK